MKVGDYIRTEKGRIDKYSPIWVEHNKFEDSYYYVFPDKEEYYDHRELIIKSSPNIIDLIEVGDYVNGIFVEGNNGKYLDTLEPDLENSSLGHIEYYRIWEKDIKSIVTKEMFTNAEYRVETN